MTDSKQLIAFVDVQRCSHTPSMPAAIREALSIFAANRGFLQSELRNGLVITVNSTDAGWRIAFSAQGG
jgi:hypothetical protein